MAATLGEAESHREGQQEQPTVLEMGKIKGRGVTGSCPTHCWED